MAARGALCSHLLRGHRTPIPAGNIAVLSADPALLIWKPVLLNLNAIKTEQHSLISPSSPKKSGEDLAQKTHLGSCLEDGAFPADVHRGTAEPSPKEVEPWEELCVLLPFRIRSAKGVFSLTLID